MNAAVEPASSDLLSFIVPAHNEQALLARALDSIRAAAERTGRPYEIIVVDDASTDCTAEIARERACRVVQVNLRQIAAVRNAGADQAGGETLVFVDADTMLPGATLAAALTALQQGAIGGGASLAFDGPTALWARALLPPANLACRLFRLPPGCFLFVKRAAFRAVGGFDLRYFAAEEWVLSQALKRQGRFVMLREPSITSGRKGTSRVLRRLIVLLLRMSLGGRKVLQQREGLEIWYDASRCESRDDQLAEKGHSSF